MDNDSSRVEAAIRDLITDQHAFVQAPLRQWPTEQSGLAPAGEFGDDMERTHLIQERQPEIVLLCLVMPQLDGIEVVKSVRKVAQRARIVVLTGNLSRGQGLAATSLRFDEDVTKSNLLGKLANPDPPRTSRSPIAPRRSAGSEEQSAMTPMSADTLTKREFEVLRYVAEGLSDGAVADVLGLSKRTVHFHIRNLFKKSAVGSRTALVHRASQLGWIP